ncbi:MAG: hypothetical protein ACOCWQ_03275 [Nanoarchaeota archaeon]
MRWKNIAAYAVTSIAAFVIGRMSLPEADRKPFDTFRHEQSWYLRTPQGNHPIHVRTGQVGSLEYRLEGIIQEHPTDVYRTLEHMEEKYKRLDAQ